MVWFGRSKHLVRLLDVVDEDSRLCLVLNHLSGGELFDRIVKVRDTRPAQ